MVIPDGVAGFPTKAKAKGAEGVPSPAAFDALSLSVWLPCVNSGNATSHANGDTVPVQVTDTRLIPVAEASG